MSDEQQIWPLRQQAFEVPHCHRNERAVGRCVNSVFAQAVGLMLL